MAEEKNHQNVDETEEQLSEESLENDTNVQEEQSEETKEQEEIVEISKSELEKLQKQAEEAEDKHLRLYAEFENYKRRTRQELSTMKEYQAQKVLNDVLPAIDNMDRALKQEGESEDFLSFKKGVNMVYNDLLNALKENGLEEIKSENLPFDPNFHQAVMQDNNPEFDSGIVIEELQKGYKLKERVLRPSMVKVNE